MIIMRANLAPIALPVIQLLDGAGLHSTMLKPLSHWLANTLG
jgi:hypothetical protein